MRHLPRERTQQADVPSARGGTLTETTEERIARRLLRERARLSEADARAIARVMAEELDALEERLRADLEGVSPTSPDPSSEP